MTLTAVISHRPGESPVKEAAFDSAEHVAEHAAEALPEQNEPVQKDVVPAVPFRRLFRLVR